MRYKCTVAYDGSNYCGWQSQTNGDSVQEQIEAALAAICKETIHITASGRTDAKVNAWGQVFHFDTERVMPCRKWKGALNGFLPLDIRIRSVEEADRFFHARYCVKEKQYDYRINFGEYNVFTRNFIYQCPYKADIEKMEEASRIFVGTHDFSSFNSNSWKETPDQVRTISSISFQKEKDVLTISYRGHGFLRYMVRMMTAALLDVGRGKMTKEDVQALLDAHSKTVTRRNAHPEGLTLTCVDYFKILAEDEQFVIREALKEDHIPEEWRRDVKEPVYVLAERHGQALHGLYEKEKHLLLAKKEDADSLGILKQQLRETDGEISLETLL